MDDRLISPEDDPTLDVEGHGMNLGNDNETVVDGKAEPAADVAKMPRTSRAISSLRTTTRRSSKTSPTSKAMR